MNICRREDRPRPRLTTPLKGSLGDCTDETQSAACDLNSIIKRYGGNLAELAAWRGSMSFGVQPPDNLEDALDVLRDADRLCSVAGVDNIADAIKHFEQSTPEPTSEPTPEPTPEPTLRSLTADFLTFHFYNSYVQNGTFLLRYKNRL